MSGQENNPLTESWTAPFGIAPFPRIATAHYRPAFAAAIAEYRADVAAIAEDAAAPTFVNTVEAFERSGRLLDQVGGVFFNLTGSDSNDALQAIERELAPVMSRLSSEVYLDERLFRRFDALLKRGGELGLSPEQARLLERLHTRFVRAGAALDEPRKERLAAIGERLATLGTRFGQNVLADEKDFVLVLETEADLAGLPEFFRASAAKAAEDRGLPGKHAVTLGRSSVEPFLQFSARRDLRERAFQAWTGRGERGGETDNLAIVAEMVALRAERANLLGYETFARFRLADAMAKTPEAAIDLLTRVWRPARLRAIEERALLQQFVQRDGGNFTIEPWDWRFYSEKRRKADFDLDEAELKPFLQLDRMIEAAFDTASRLFGLAFTERRDLELYHPDARAFEVTGPSGEPVALFIGDYFARPSKRSGAWMSAFRSQQKLAGDIRPMIVNVMNFAQGGDGAPTLLSFDDARTLFHEFGHALHGMLSDVTYPTLAGTAVSRDFVEFPSQLYEHWIEQPDVLRRFAVHYRTGEEISEALVGKLLAARTFNQGCTTVEYVSSALVDLHFHQLPSAEGLDPKAFQQRTLDGIGMPEGFVMRHATPHFQHVFAGDGYSSAYYSYLWSEVLDADGFDAFREAGDVFDPQTARRLKDFVYAAGNARDPAAAYTAFRGRMPTPDALLRKRGLVMADGGEV